jgi:hypothetical protein
MYQVKYDSGDRFSSVNHSHPEMSSNAMNDGHNRTSRCGPTHAAQQQNGALKQPQTTSFAQPALHAHWNSTNWPAAPLDGPFLFPLCLSQK